MTAPFDYRDLARCLPVASIACDDHATVEAYLRTRIEAAFVPVERCNHFAALAEARYHAGREATARAEAAEAENARLRAKLKLIADGLPCELANGKIVNAPFRGQEAQRIAAQALGGEHER